MNASKLDTGLARISHQSSTAAADLLAVAVCAPCSRFDVVSTTTAPTSSPRSPPKRHLDTLTTNARGKCGLEALLIKARWMNRSLGDIKIKKESRHSGQRLLLIRNAYFSTAYWIPVVRHFGQARHDEF